MTEAEIVLSASFAVGFRMTLDIPISLTEIAAEMSISYAHRTPEELLIILTERRTDIVTKTMSMIKLFS